MVGMGGPGGALALLAVAAVARVRPQGWDWSVGRAAPFQEYVDERPVWGAPRVGNGKKRIGRKEEGVPVQGYVGRLAFLRQKGYTEYALEDTDLESTDPSFLEYQDDMPVWSG
jgi:hypothetical protein